MSRSTERTLLEEWERLDSTRNEGRRQRAEVLARLDGELSAVRNALSEALASHRRAEEQEVLAELDCGQMLRDALASSSAELQKETTELKKARAECSALSDEAARSLETTTEVCLENAALMNQIEALRKTLAEQEAENARLSQAHDDAVDQLLSLRRDHETAQKSLSDQQRRLEVAHSDFEEAVRSQSVASARLGSLQSELDAARRNLAWQQTEFEDLRSGHEQERNLIRGRLAEEREAHVAKALEARTLLDQARMRALAAEDEAAQSRRQQAAEVQELRSRLVGVEAELGSLRESSQAQQQELDAKRSAHEATLAELASTQAALRYADERMTEMSLALDLVRTSHVLTSGEQSGAEGSSAEVPMTRSSAPPRKRVKRRSLPPRPDASPGGYSMTEIEIRDEVGTDPAVAKPARNRTRP